MPSIEIAAEKIFNIFGFVVTNALLMSWVSAALLIIGALIISKKLSAVPAFFQNIFEFFIEKAMELMEGIFGSRHAAEEYFPIVATIFLFILTSNWLGILPGTGSVGLFKVYEGKEVFVPLFRSAASDLNFTLGLAIITVVLVNIYGVRSLGWGKHWSKFFTFKGPIDFFVGILEFISEFAKMISFSFRLFGNVFAGEILLTIMAFLAPFFIPVPFLALEVFVGFIQALVFSMLAMIFISVAVSAHSH